ncbi:MAG: DUF6850 family outer membrane beta-barrel protein [Pseudobacter sp.]|uniref:DUF6850 family outer membrane beta-barrel protein n=1 Tax=Pseudobacter sp. TaxID=2045420 RepID=UPI003F80E108
MISLRSNIISLFILLLPGIGLAQQDSALQPHTESFQLQYNRYARDVISQPLLKHRNYGSVQLGYRSEEGGYMEAQAPQKQNELFFYTEGSKQIRKILVSGSFGWYNNQTDSQAFTLRQNFKDPVPYYYYAAQPGNWQTIRYKLQGIASAPILNDKLTIGAGGTYNSFNAWRSNDPRPEEFNYELSGQALLHYKILPKHTLGIAGGYTRKNYDNTWEYRNDNNSTRPLLAVYIQNGYGNVEPMKGMLSGFISTNTNGYTAEGLYEGIFSIGTITATGKYQKNKTEVFRKPMARDELKQVFGTYKDDSYTLNVNWHKKTVRNLYNISFDYFDELGKDQNERLAANNYIYAMQQASIAGLWSRLNNDRKMKYEIGVAAKLEDQLKMDGSVGQKAEYQSVNACVSGAYYFYFPASKSSLKTGLRAGFRQPLHAEAVSVSQIFLFSQGVVYRDYYYFNASSVNMGATLNYQFPVKKLKAFITAAGNYVNASIPASVAGLIPYSYPGNNRMQWQCSIGLNL